MALERQAVTKHVFVDTLPTATFGMAQVNYFVEAESSHYPKSRRESRQPLGERAAALSRAATEGNRGHSSSTVSVLSSQQLTRRCLALKHTKHTHTQHNGGVSLSVCLRGFGVPLDKHVCAHQIWLRSQKQSNITTFTASICKIIAWGRQNLWCAARSGMGHCAGFWIRVLPAHISDCVSELHVR